MRWKSSQSPAKARIGGGGCEGFKWLGHKWQAWAATRKLAENKINAIRVLIKRLDQVENIRRPCREIMFMPSFIVKDYFKYETITIRLRHAKNTLGDGGHRVRCLCCLLYSGSLRLFVYWINLFIPLRLFMVFFKISAQKFPTTFGDCMVALRDLLRSC